VNHYENHDLATDWRPRRERLWGTAATDQTLVWMFAADGVPMLFTGNEAADADERHSMFGRTPVDWSQLEREPGRSRCALVKRLAALRRDNPVFTDVNGAEGLTWLDTTAPDETDRGVRGAVAPEPLFARDARPSGPRSFALGPWGFWISRVEQARPEARESAR